MFGIPLSTFSFTLAKAEAAFEVTLKDVPDARVRIRAPLKDGDLGRASSLCHIGVLMMSNAITSLRQAAEWGMGESRKSTDN
ncbi:hypothetical protein DYB28_012494 [Aphanomyces astaci]|uniref:Uncharacterized protein n=1 Tax=Aphanomyces astaci TaxID=112090 RepID=A0A9X8HF92_APHAT|nr:hypothetical protein DYB28_012494 [Aphanomyces astaci]